MTTVSYSQSTLNVKAFIEGYYDSVSGTMTPTLDSVAQPTLFDTITVELAQSNDGIVVCSEKAVFDVNGNASITLPPVVFGNYYFLVLKHRNSITTWSALPVLITAVTNYDFTLATTQAFGDNLKWVNNAACIYSGDLNQDGRIDSFDFLIIDGDIQNGTWGYYLMDDLNGDYAVDLLDYIILDNNIQLQIYTISPVFTGIDDQTGKEIVQASVYPNPADTYVKINTPANSDQQISLISVNGQTAFNDLMKNGSTRINTSELKEGIYIITMKDQPGSQKIQIRH